MQQTRILPFPRVGGKALGRRLGFIVVATVAIVCLSASSAATLPRGGETGSNCQEGSTELGVLVTLYATPVQVVNREIIDSRLVGLNVVSNCISHFELIIFGNDVSVVIAPGANVSWGPSELRRTPLWHVPASPFSGAMHDDAVFPCFWAGSFDVDYLLTADGQLVPLTC